MDLFVLKRPLEFFKNAVGSVRGNSLAGGSGSAPTTNHPDDFNPDLAVSLNNHSNCLSDLGHRECALEMIQDVVDPRRQLATDRPSAVTNFDHHEQGLKHFVK